MIYWKTLMKEIPTNCADCKLVEWCPYPVKADGVHIRKSCVTKRHKDCPLVEVTEDKA